MSICRWKQPECRTTENINTKLKFKLQCRMRSIVEEKTKQKIKNCFLLKEFSDLVWKHQTNTKTYRHYNSKCIKAIHILPLRFLVYCFCSVVDFFLMAAKQQSNNNENRKPKNHMNNEAHNNNNNQLIIFPYGNYLWTRLVIDYYYYFLLPAIVIAFRNKLFNSIDIRNTMYFILMSDYTEN